MKHGIIPTVEVERPPTDLEFDSMAFENKQRLEEEMKRKKAEQKMKEEEDDDEGFEDDDDFMKQYREKRLAQMQANMLRNKFGSLIEISQVDYKQEVTNAPADLYVVVFLYKQG